MRLLDDGHPLASRDLHIDLARRQAAVQPGHFDGLEG